MLYEYGEVPPTSVIVNVEVFTELSGAHPNAVAVPETVKGVGSPTGTTAVAEHPLPELTWTV